MNEYRPTVTHLLQPVCDWNMESLVSLGFDLSLHRWEFGRHLMKYRICRNEPTKWQHRLMAGGDRSVDMSVNFSRKTLNNVPCL